MNATERIHEFRRAVVRFGEALAEPDDNPLVIDASIQRFEFSVELAWKSLREVLLRDHGVDAASPKSVLRHAYQLSIVSNESLWLAMLQDRNLTSHTYRETLAREIFARLPAYLIELQRLATALL